MYSVRVMALSAAFYGEGLQNGYLDVFGYLCLSLCSRCAGQKGCCIWNCSAAVFV